MNESWKNPFSDFLASAEGTFRKISQVPEVNERPELIPAFVTLLESRRFLFDVVDRVQTLKTAFDRMHELSPVYREAEAKFLETSAGEARELRNRCQHEAMGLTAFVYYEMSTLVQLNRNLKLKPRRDGSLEYLVGVRNTLLVHPRETGRIKQSRNSLWIGEILSAELLGASWWIPVVKEHYLHQLRKLGQVDLDDDAGAQRNERLIRSGRKVECFNEEEILRLKAYPVREPDLIESATELAELLSQKFLPKLEEVCTRSL